MRLPHLKSHKLLQSAQAPPTLLDVKPVGHHVKLAATFKPGEPLFRFSVGMFRWAWIIVLVAHSFTVVFNAAVASLYWWILNEPRMGLQIAILGSELTQFFRPVVYTSVVIASIHALMISRALVCSMWYRGLHFGSPKPSKRRLSTNSRITRSFQSATDLAWKVSSWQDKLWSVITLRPIEVELVLELFLQTFQAYRMSTLVSTVWINRLLAVVIVLNCWFSPLVHTVMRKRSAITRQLVCVAMDSFLDIVYGVFIPLAVFYPYWRDFDLYLCSFPFMFYYRDEWYVNAIAENQQLFVTSWLDFAATMSPGASLFLRLYEIQRILMAYQRTNSVRTHPNDVRHFGSRRLIAVSSSGSRAACVRRGLHILLVVWGIVVAALHIHSTVVAVQGADRGCIVEMRPWGSNVYTCTVLEVSCSQKKIVGREDEMDKAFRVVDAPALQGLIMSNCPTLEVPPRIQLFERLLQLKIYNSTVVEWRKDASLTATAHTNLQVLFMLEVNFTEFPMGLRWEEPLPAFYDFELSGTNLTSIPDEMETAWGGLGILSIELAPGFTQVPAFAGRLPALYMLLLASNSITTVPDDLLTDSQLYYLMLINNPLERIPERVGSLTGLGSLGFSSTKVNEIPVSWRQPETTFGSEEMISGGKVDLHLHDTPYCDGLPDSSSFLASTELHGEFMVGWFDVWCHQYFVLPYFYPVEEETQPIAIEELEKRRYAH
ncbi:hypothetical protein Poli38472_007998 [Pythium oligandrum]|uniref:Uncharacterized protein n=1 Tax=Pythium oligandrum TaxID=41045 RepID=A0A8K1FJW0_PYTOL|nr:hypothetical protein Poli38472_007998 [Pythium oligandrum]|eukprot:TMW65356.1 hypothetical protein Poli38472_007998 [Pythium oligandrum]